MEFQYRFHLYTFLVQPCGAR
ncbi:hypothetical protein LINGRAHAP2_LOCUS36077 [Linum grandiflorum]